MPIYEYKCGSCGETVDASRSMEDRNTILQCPLCGGDAYFESHFSVSVVGSQKQWSGRKEVNFFVDDRKTIAKKQAALYVNSGRLDKFCETKKQGPRNKTEYLKGIGKMIDKAPPIKVDV